MDSAPVPITTHACKIFGEFCLGGIVTPVKNATFAQSCFEGSISACLPTWPDLPSDVGHQTSLRYLHHQFCFGENIIWVKDEKNSHKRSKVAVVDTSCPLCCERARERETSATRPPAYRRFLSTPKIRAVVPAGNDARQSALACK